MKMLKLSMLEMMVSRKETTTSTSKRVRRIVRIEKRESSRSVKSFQHLHNMKSIVNTEIVDLPRMFKVDLGKDTRGFNIWLNMQITKEVKEHWDRRSNARDIHLNELDWYYSIRFDFDSNMRSETYKFDYTTEEGKKAGKDWYHEMTDDKHPLPIVIDHSREGWLFDIFRRNYKEIFSELYIDEDLYLKILRAAKRANENNQKIYTHKQMQVINNIVSYYRTTFYNVDKYHVSKGLRKANLETDRDYDMQEEYLVEVVSNSRIENLISMIPPNINGWLGSPEIRERVKRFVVNRKKKSDRKNVIDSILS